MKRKITDCEGGGGETWERSVCLRVCTSEHKSMFWYIIKLSSSKSVIQPCYEENVRKMEKEAKLRQIRVKKKLINQRIFAKSEDQEEEEEEYSTPILTPICQTLGIPNTCFWTAMGSVVYCVGAKRETEQTSSWRFGPSVRFWNLLDMDKEGGGCWDRTPPMINSRSRGKAVTIGDDIYVFGGTKKLNFNEDFSKPWSEVLKTCPKDDDDHHHHYGWKPLKEPPHRLVKNCSDLFALPYHDGKKILLGSCSSFNSGLYAYHVYEDSWEVIEKRFNFVSHTEPVLVGNTMYWVGNEVIGAYDLHTREFFSGPTHFWALNETLSLAIHMRSKKPLFLHLHDDTFCLIWDNLHYVHGSPCLRSILVCHMLRVFKCADQKAGKFSLTVKAVSTEYFLIDDGRVQSFDGMVLNLGMEEEVMMGSA